MASIYHERHAELNHIKFPAAVYSSRVVHEHVRSAPLRRNPLPTYCVFIHTYQRFGAPLLV